MRLNLEDLSAETMLGAGAEIAAQAARADCRMRAAEGIVQMLWDRCRDAGELRCAVLVRCFQTCAYGKLPVEYQLAADRVLDSPNGTPDMRCLTLLATRGLRHTWNDPQTSLGHQAIPLPSVGVVRAAPMIARLFEELGLPLEKVVRPGAYEEPFLLSRAATQLKVFHVAEALGSPFIPAQEGFVKPFGVRSVVGMGGMLPDGELFVVLLFARVTIPRHSALLFQTLTPDVRDCLAKFGPKQIFPRNFHC